MRPIWVALDAMLSNAAGKGRPLEEGTASGWQDMTLSSVCKPLVDRLLGYQVGSSKARDQRSRPVPAQGSYMDVVKTCVNEKCCLLADEVGDAHWRRRLLSPIAHDSLAPRPLCSLPHCSVGSGGHLCHLEQPELERSGGASSTLLQSSD